MLGKLTFAARLDRTREGVFDPDPFLDDVLRYAFFRLGSREDAEDVVAQVRHAAIKDGSRVAAAEDARVYLIGMARRKVADVLRRRARSLRLRSLDDPSFVPPGGGEKIDAILQRAAIAAVMRRLPDDQREALALKYLVGLSATEIATLTDRTPAAVNSLLQRAREAFAAFAGEGFEEETR
ncbi:MAG: RNA polymerase sigma factor [Fimbriimonas sp.]